VEGPSAPADAFGSGGVSSGASMEGAEEDAAPVNLGLRTMAEDLSGGDAPTEEVPPLATLIEEGSGTGMPDSLPEVETQVAPPPHQANAFFAGRTNEEIVREKPQPREVMAVAQEESLVVGGEAAGAALAGVVSQKMPATLAFTEVANPSHGGRASPSLAQTGGDLPAREVLGTRVTPLQ
jgi:hypothetical protein